MLAVLQLRLDDDELDDLSCAKIIQLIVTFLILLLELDDELIQVDKILLFEELQLFDDDIEVDEAELLDEAEDELVIDVMDIIVIDELLLYVVE